MLNKKFISIYEYIKKHLLLIITFSAVIIIFAVIFNLYSLPLYPVLYALLLSLILIAVVSAIRFTRFRKKHKLLSLMKNTVDVSIDNLPASDSIIESDYKSLLLVLNNCKNDMQLKYDKQMSDLNDYYTMWAHQIKTPIAAMQLLLQTNDGAIDEELSEQLFKIEQYVDMVMQYLRTESMSDDLMLKEYSLDDIIKTAVRKYKKQFIRKKIVLNYSDVNCKILTDEKWLEFVIEQILSNSLKYTNSGSVSIYMKDNEDKTLIIEDTGIGIRDEDLPRVFERGFTGYNGRQDKKSTGIGLYLCKIIMTKLSHKILITSEVEKGSKVILCLKTIETTYE